MAENTKYVVQIRKTKNGWALLLNHVENGRSSKSETGPHELNEALLQGISKLNEWKEVEGKKAGSSRQKQPATGAKS